MCYIVNDTGMVVAGPMDEQEAINYVDCAEYEDLTIVHA